MNRLSDNGGPSRDRKNNRTNGTVTLRRSSTTPFTKSSAVDGSLETTAELEESQQSISFYEQSADTRYSKNQMLEVFRAQQNLEATSRDVSSLFVNNWNPGHSNGANGRSGWGKHDGRDTHGPHTCWDSDGSVQPISLEEMTEAERSVSFPSHKFRHNAYSY